MKNIINVMPESGNSGTEEKTQTVSTTVCSNYALYNSRANAIDFSNLTRCIGLKSWDVSKLNARCGMLSLDYCYDTGVIAQCDQYENAKQEQTATVTGVQGPAEKYKTETKTITLTCKRDTNVVNKTLTFTNNIKCVKKIECTGSSMSKEKQGATIQSFSISDKVLTLGSFSTADPPNTDSVSNTYKITVYTE